MNQTQINTEVINRLKKKEGIRNRLEQQLYDLEDETEKMDDLLKTNQEMSKNLILKNIY